MDTWAFTAVLILSLTWEFPCTHCLFWLYYTTPKGKRTFKGLVVMAEPIASREL
uniref:Uncharacterized protein n=1 Tax=Rhizophora mucronata TaxID=61149 RepID=A0A2P2P4Y8_RHIMU